MKRLRWLVASIAVGSTLIGAPQWRDVMRQPEVWYASAEAREVAGSVMLYQTESGGWPKNTDMSQPPSAKFLDSDKQDVRAATIDNNATTMPMELLARIQSASPDDTIRASLERAIDYLLVSQYANGGWPQYYPLHKGYYTHVTFNDNAMINVMELLRDLGHGEAPWTWVDETRRAQALAAVDRGISCILKCQVVVDGVLTAWCAQHDEVTLAPAAARKFEPIALSGGESVGIVRFLMHIKDPSPEVRRAVEAAMAWFEAVRIRDQKIVRTPIEIDGKPDEDISLADDPDGPGVWARFYEIGTNRPIFMGRDMVVHYTLAEVEIERRAGYGYYGTWAATLVTKDFPRWQKKFGASAESAKPPHGP